MFWVLFSLLIVVVLFLSARPKTIHDAKGPSGKRFVVVNNLTGNYCFDGQLFRTEKAALRKLSKIDDPPWGDIFTVVQVFYSPTMFAK